MAFFDRLRTALRKYEDGVHEVGDAVDAKSLKAAERRIGRSLPTGLSDLYRSFDGIRLFCETYTIWGTDGISSSDLDDGLIAIGEGPEGLLFVDKKGIVFLREEAGDSILAGTTLERFLDAVLAREALLVDREGEFKEVFEPTGEIDLKVRAKRAQVAIKLDGGAALWHFDAAETALESGEAEAAEAALERALKADEHATAAWAFLGALRRLRDAQDAEDCFVRSAAGGLAEVRAERLAEAARLALERGDERARRSHADSSRKYDETLAERFFEEAQSLRKNGDDEGALSRAALSSALDPNGEATALLDELRRRRKLPVLK